MKSAGTCFSIKGFWEGLPIEKLTLFAIIIIGAFYLFVFPPNSSPDESVHFRAAYQNVDAVLGQTSSDVKSVSIRTADNTMITDFSRFPDAHSYSYFKEELFKPLPAGGSEIINVERTSGVPQPYIYYPQTLGMLLGLALHVNPIWLYMLGRIFNLIFYAVCVWLSVKLTPVGKGLFAVMALWPMAMELAASLNSDVYSIELAFLAIAQYLRIAYAEEPSGIRDIVLLLATMALLGPPKVVFLPIMMLAFFMPRRCFASLKTANIYRIVVVVVFVITTFISYYVYIHRADGGVPVVTFMDQQIYTFSDLFADPLLFAKMCYRTIKIYTEFYLNSMIGSDLGWLEIRINKIVIEAFLALAVIGAFKSSAAEKTLIVRDRIQFLAIFLISAFGMAVIMFVSWTPVGSWNIIGLQGRYFLPAFPLFVLFAARWKKPVRPAWLSDKNLVLVACCLSVFVLVSAYIFISGRSTAA